jgi:hypothetical protein
MDRPSYEKNIDTEVLLKEAFLVHAAALATSALALPTLISVGFR